MDAAMVERVRRFHRTVTQRIGALDDAYLSHSRPLGHSRVLWEIGPAGSEVRSLRNRLGLDSGYLSRVLHALKAEGLIVIEGGQADGRVHTARLTTAGLAERAELDRLSDELAASILQPLTDRQRRRLIAAMVDIERLLVPSTVEISIVDPRLPDARRCLDAYAAELTREFEGGFDPDRSISATADDLTPPAGLLLLATLHAEPVGCGALKLHPDAPAEIKRMWVAPGMRGLGLGRRLLAELETHAAARGVRTLRLETNRALATAIGLYRAAGYREVGVFNHEPYAHHWFEKTLEPDTIATPHEGSTHDGPS